MDPAEDFVKFAGQWVSGGEGVVSGLDLDGAVAAGGLDEFLNGPAGGLLDPAADGQGGEHDGQVSVDGLAFAVAGRPGLQVVLGHAEAFLRKLSLTRIIIVLNF